MVKVSKSLLLLLSALSLTAAVKQDNNGGAVGGVGTQVGGVCQKIISKACPDFPSINSKLNQVMFDNEVQKKITEMKNSLRGTGMCPTYESDFSAKVRYLKTIACADVISNQGCAGSTSICPGVCTQFTISLNGMSCIKTQNNKVTDFCSKVVHKNDCLDYYDSELNSCGFENAASKATFCATNSNLKCCGGTGILNTGNNQNNNNQIPSSTTTSDTTKTDKASSPTESSQPEKKKSGNFFTSKTFIIILIIFALVIGILGYFYYVGSKDEKEENMRN